MVLGTFLSCHLCVSGRGMVGAPTPVIEWTLGTRPDVDFSGGLPADGMTSGPTKPAQRGGLDLWLGLASRKMAPWEGGLKWAFTRELHPITSRESE